MEERHHSWKDWSQAPRVVSQVVFWVKSLISHCMGDVLILSASWSKISWQSVTGMGILVYWCLWTNISLAESPLLLILELRHTVGIDKCKWDIIQPHGSWCSQSDCNSWIATRSLLMFSTHWIFTDILSLISGEVPHWHVTSSIAHCLSWWQHMWNKSHIFREKNELSWSFQYMGSKGEMRSEVSYPSKICYGPECVPCQVWMGYCNKQQQDYLWQCWGSYCTVSLHALMSVSFLERRILCLRWAWAWRKSGHSDWRASQEERVWNASENVFKWTQVNNTIFSMLNTCTQWHLIGWYVTVRSIFACEVWRDFRQTS